MDWASKKLQRLCRSSLSAEARASALGVYALARTGIYQALSLRPDLSSDAAMQYFGQSPFITGAQRSRGASRSATAGLGIAEERAASEVKVANEQTADATAVWRRANARQRLAG